MAHAKNLPAALVNDAQGLARKIADATDQISAVCRRFELFDPHNVTERELGEFVLAFQLANKTTVTTLEEMFRVMLKHSHPEEREA